MSGGLAGSELKQMHKLQAAMRSSAMSINSVTKKPILPEGDENHKYQALMNFDSKVMQ